MKNTDWMRRRTDGTWPRPWVFDELGHAGGENLNPEHVALYDDKEDANASAEVERLRHLGLGRRSTVIDLGAGTGQFTLAVAPWCRSVIAVDVSPPMVDRLKAKVSAAGYTNLEVILAGFLTFEHQQAPVDFAYSRWALHHLGDAWQAVACTASGELSETMACYDCSTSPTRSTRQSWLTESSSGGPRCRRGPTSQVSGSDPTSTSTSGTSTPLSPGYSNR